MTRTNSAARAGGTTLAGRAARVLTGAIAVAASLALATSAQAAPRGEEALQLSWDGHAYTATTSESFLGDPVIVPGDTNSRPLQVRNDGPTSGVLRASIINVQIQGPDDEDNHHNPAHLNPRAGTETEGAYAGAGDQGSFYEDLMISWTGGTASFAELHANGSTEILQLELAEGEQVPITVDYGLIEAATSGNRANIEPRLASFDVLVEIGGALPALPDTKPTDPAAPADPGGPPQVATGDTHPVIGASTPSPALQVTGTQGMALLVIAALILGAGLALRASSRRGLSATGR